MGGVDLRDGDSDDLLPAAELQVRVMPDVPLLDEFIAPAIYALRSEDVFVVAQMGADLAGCIFGEADQQSDGFVRVLVVAADYQNWGIGSSLLAACAHRAHSRSVKTVFVDLPEAAPNERRLLR